MAAYYNEIDPYAAQWLRNLILAGHIAPGEVDERSIADVAPDDLRGFDQCHFFAGIGGWSLALRLAGWDDSRPVWTGSCPCQPFSAAGKGLGEKDPRHLWPEFHRLIAECRPPIVFGEQVASAAGREWLAGVRADLEGLAYAVGAADLCAASSGAPHIRQRLWWVADANGGQSRDGALQRGVEHRREPQDACLVGGADSGRESHWLADADASGQREQRRGGLLDGERPASGHDADGCGAVCGLEHTESDGRQQRRPESSRRGAAGGCGESGLGDAERSRLERHAGHGDDTGRRPLTAGSTAAPSRLGPWSEYLWIPCADGKARRIKPGIEPLAHGIPGRVGRLRAYGNAIVPAVAAEFIAAVMRCMP